MSWLQIPGSFGLPDAGALALLALAWAGSDWLIEHPPRARQSVSVLMVHYRREWMRQFVTRQPRIFDASIIDNLRQGTAFFSSACMIAIGGGAALLANPSRIASVAADLTPNAVTDAIEVRVLLVLLFLADALLKFVWSNRLFAYCAVLMAAVPNDPDDPQAFAIAAQVAELNITAARGFNRGLRGVYFALAALAWLLGPLALAVATLLATAVLLRREFFSHSRRIILSGRR